VQHLHQGDERILPLASRGRSSHQDRLELRTLRVEKLVIQTLGDEQIRRLLTVNLTLRRRSEFKTVGRSLGIGMRCGNVSKSANGLGNGGSSRIPSQSLFHHSTKSILTVTRANEARHNGKHRRE
jgi:hypothetical protein